MIGKWPYPQIFFGEADSQNSPHMLVHNTNSLQGRK